MKAGFGYRDPLLDASQRNRGGGGQAISCKTKLSHLSENLPLMTGQMKLLVNELCVGVWNQVKDDKMLTKN